MSRYALVAIGYNRPQSMERLLNALNNAKYYEPIDLLISIDNSGNSDVVSVADAFQWNHGEKKIYTYEQRLGLRKHILHCGDFLQEYEAIAVFEDDVVPVVGFYNFMKEAVEKYKNDSRIAGISLYSPMVNNYSSEPFEPVNTEYDIYFMQLAQSWGQIWMRESWQAFKTWYDEHTDTPFDDLRIPRHIRSWNKSSWLKYHIRYCIENDKYFVYPYVSLTTCYSEAGEHTSTGSAMLQVNCLFGEKSCYRFAEFDDSVKYDAFMERCCDDIEFDLYGGKELYVKQKVASIKCLPYKVLSTYGLQLRPHEMNVLHQMPGKVIKLYDLSSKSKIIHEDNKADEFRYRFKLYNQSSKMTYYLLHRLKWRIKNIFISTTVKK